MSTINAAPLFRHLTEATAPPAAAPLFAKLRELFGFVPNMAVAMAAEPAALGGYLEGLGAFGATALAAIEQQIVLMAVSRANAAPYPVAVHASLAAKLGCDPATIQAVAAGRPPTDPRLAALQGFTEALAVGRGQVTPAELKRFLAAGFDAAAVVAVAFGVAVKTFANAMAHLGEPAIDEAFAPALAAA